MKAIVLKQAKTPLVFTEVPKPIPQADEVLIKVEACGICRTDLHILDAELDQPTLPLIPGHQIVGRIEALGKKVTQLKKNQYVGVGWLGGTCHHCYYCLHEQENLCDTPRFTGYQHNGGFAEYATARADFCFPLDESYPAEQAAPLLCAGLIGFRAWRMCESPKTLGIYGFGAAAHILTQVARHFNCDVYAFTREGDIKTQQFARALGAIWAGDSAELPPQSLDAAIIFAPVGSLVPQALKAVCKGGIVVCAGIHMSDIPSFPYSTLWEERQIRSVANLTRQDGHAFLALAAKIPIKTEVTVYPLEQTAKALEDLRFGQFQGAGVVSIV